VQIVKADLRAALGDGSQFGITIHYADEGDRLLGTAGAIRHALDQGKLGEGFLVLCGDSYLPIEIEPVWQASERGRRPLMTVLRNVNQWDRSNVRFANGLVHLYDKGVCDPVASGIEFIDYGLSVLTRDVIFRLAPKDMKSDLSDVAKTLSQESILRGYEVFNRFYEIGSPSGLADFAQWLERRG
jgi:NDP-sugar pyrophosphorylase family protein